MSYCSFCNEYDDDTHPVSFGLYDKNDPRVPKEIKPYIGLGHYLDDLDASAAEDEFWENCAHLCDECFKKYYHWIVWWG